MSTSKKRKVAVPPEKDIRNFFGKNKSDEEENSPNTKSANTTKNPTDTIVCEKCSTKLKAYDLQNHQAFDCPPKKFSPNTKPIQDAKKKKAKAELLDSSESTDVYNIDRTIEESTRMKVKWSDEVKGLGLVLDFLTEIEAQELFDNLRKDPWLPSAEFSGNRYQQQYGPVVDFKNGKILEDFHEFPSYSLNLLKKMNERVLQLKDFTPNHQLNNYYLKDAGHSIIYHTDNRGVFGDIVVSISLLGGCHFMMQHVKDPKLIVPFPFPKNSLMIMTDKARYDWKHGLPNSALLSPIRISVTFRATKKAL